LLDEVLEPVAELELLEPPVLEDPDDPEEL
jgi:hypothetical protein